MKKTHHINHFPQGTDHGARNQRRQKYGWDDQCKNDLNGVPAQFGRFPHHVLQWLRQSQNHKILLDWPTKRHPDKSGHQPPARLLHSVNIGHHTGSLAVDQGRNRFEKLLNRDSVSLVKAKASVGLGGIR